MSQRLTCPRGHEWDFPVGPSGVPPPVCPVCGAAGQPDNDLQPTLQPPYPRAATAPPQAVPPPPQPVAGDWGTSQGLPTPHPRTASEGAAEHTALTDPPPPPAGFPGAAPSIPGYEILAVLGRGGMGVVYQARQTRLKRVVALKMILAGPHAVPHQLARFRAEAEVVARLQHPNIVQVYEVGEHDGLPFFSLEYLDGGSLADRLNGIPLTPDQAACLVETLARAMHYAHERGVVHRDLKPANVLLSLSRPAATATGERPAADVALAAADRLNGRVPKVADFGVAKQMDGSDVQTRTGMLMGTPSYMAPEQAQGHARDVGPACDTYALGAILYELLTGRPPFRAASGVETLHQVITVDPVPPTRLQPKVPRDLETITLECLHKEPHRRYASAAALAEDLRRFLAREPIRARPAGLWGRVVKWARRRPSQAALAAVSAVAAAVLLGLWVSFTLELRAERDNAQRAHDRAEANFQRATRAVDHMLTEVGAEELENEPRMEKKQRALLQKALAFYQEFLAERGDDPAVRLKAGLAYKRVADIQRVLKQYGPARAAYEKAIALLGDLAQANPGGADTRHALADSYNWLGELLRTGPAPDEAQPAYERARALQEALVADFPSDPAYRKDLARSEANLGVLLKDTGRPADADRAFRRATAILTELARQAPDRPAYRHELARCQINLGPVLRALGRGAAAEAAYQRALDLLHELARQEPASRTYRHDLLVAANNAGNFYSSRPAPPVHAPAVVGLLAAPDGRAWLAPLAVGPAPLREIDGERALALHRQAVALGEELVHDFPSVPDYRNQLANTHISLGSVLSRHDAVGAAAAWETARELLAKLVADFPEVAEYQGDLGMTLGNLGWLLAREGSRDDAAAARLHEGIALVRAALKPNPQHPTYRKALRAQYEELPAVLLRLGRHQEAAQAALELGRLPAQTATEFYVPARLLARCAAAVEADDGLAEAERRALAAGYGAAAARLLEEALGRGHAEVRAWVAAERTFARWRCRPDFVRLLKGSRGGAAPNPPR